MKQKIANSIRNVALVGPYSSGKTSLLESLLFVTGKINRKGNIKEQNTVGDSSPEAREHQMSVEISLARTEYQDIEIQFVDCPGSVEFLQETYNALIGVGAAVVVCEPVVDLRTTNTILQKNGSKCNIKPKNYRRRKVLPIIFGF